MGQSVKSKSLTKNSVARIVYFKYIKNHFDTTCRKINKKKTRKSKIGIKFEKLRDDLDKK